MSRLDKLLTTVVAGSATLIFMLLLNRFGILKILVDSWYALWSPEPVRFEFPEVRYTSEYAVTTEKVPQFSALTLLGFIAAQSGVGFVGGYLLGTFVHVTSSLSQRSDEDLQQPWETAVRQSAFGDTVTVITKNGEEIRGRLYRIGSPSKDYDMLLSAGKKVVEGGTIPLGMTYHHYEDISQVRFPDIIPSEPSDEGNWLVQKYTNIQKRIQDLRDCSNDQNKSSHSFSQSEFHTAAENAYRLYSYIRAVDED